MIRSIITLVMQVNNNTPVIGNGRGDIFLKTGVMTACFHSGGTNETKKVVGKAWSIVGKEQDNASKRAKVVIHQAHCIKLHFQLRCSTCMKVEADDHATVRCA